MSCISNVRLTLAQGKNSVRPTFLHPDTLNEAVQMLAEYGQRAFIIGGSESPPPGTPHCGVFIETSRLVDLAGIHRLGGRMIIGANTPHSIIARASLIRMHGTCLAEACEETNHPFASVLTYDFRSEVGYPFTILALAALDAEIESAWLGSGGVVERRWSALDDVWNPDIAWDSRMVLAVRFSVGSAASGSALIIATPPPGTAALVLAAAARLSLDASKCVISDVKTVLAPKKGAPFPSPGAAAYLRGRNPDSDHIEQAAHAALLDAQSRLSSPSLVAAYRIDLAAHLTRQALDHSLARALRDHAVGRI